MTPELLLRIEMGLRQDYLTEEEATDQACADRDFISAAYSRLKGELNKDGFRNSFTEANQKARLEWLEHVVKSETGK